jgi:glycosyltransferase involved in cell wall biosynthesis
MRLLWLNWRDIQHPWAGGAEVHLHETAKRLVKMGHAITVLSSHSGNLPKQDCIDGYRVVRVADNDSYPLGACPLLRRLGKQFDIVIEDYSKFPLYVPFLIGFAKRTLVIVHHLNRRVYFGELPLFKALIAYILETVMPYIYTRIFRTQMVAVSESTAKELVALKADPRMVTVIHNGAPNPGRDHLSWEEKTPEPTLAYLGRLKKYKQPEHALLAFRLVLRDFPNAKMVIMGDGERLHNLQRIVATLKIPNVQFTGRVDNKTKTDFMAKAWLLLQTSQREGWGLAVIEAGDCGTPSVVYDVEGLRDSVRDKVTGLVVQPNITRLASATIELLADKERLQGMSQRAMDYAKKFSWNETARKFDNLFARYLTE